MMKIGSWNTCLGITNKKDLIKNITKKNNFEKFMAAALSVITQNEHGIINLEIVYC